jgi:tetratricopeptide (TPR) repeat protein
MGRSGGSRAQGGDRFGNRSGRDPAGAPVSRRGGRDPGRRPGAGSSRPGGPPVGPPDRAHDERVRGWGSVARRGTRNLEPDADRPREDARDRGRPAERMQEQWIDEGPVRDEAQAAVARGAGFTAPKRKRRGAQPAALPDDVTDEIGRSVGPSLAERSQRRLQEAARAYAAERFADARRILAPMAEQAPDVAAVRELHGLSLYRLGKWRDAIKELEAFATLTGAVDQHPVMADCHRALGHGPAVERLWDELRRGGADADVLAEGRIVRAAAMADAGDLRGAIGVLEEGPVGVRNPKYYHLRLWYALGALYERAGDVPRARELFRRIIMVDADFADAEARFDNLA